MAKNERFSNFVFTCNIKDSKRQDSINSQLLSDAIKELDPQYFVFAREIGLNGNEHFQGYVELSKQLYFTTIIKSMLGSHIENRKGTQKQAIDYVLKRGAYEEQEGEKTSTGEFTEWGTPKTQPSESKRTDMTDFVNAIKEGANDLQLLTDFPTLYFMYNKNITTIRQTLITEKYKAETRHVDVIYISGPTGTGKTRSLYEIYGAKAYKITDYEKGPFDNYNGEEIIILEEFRGDFTIKFMLQLLDRYPMQLPCRYANKWACYTKVFILSNIDIDEQYPNMRFSPTYDALLRRIEHQIYFPVKQYDKNLQDLKDLLEKIQKDVDNDLPF
jgi:hypothetical protein